MVPITQVVTRAERSRFRPSLGGGRDGSVPLLLSMPHRSPFMGLERGTSCMPVGYSETPHVRHFVGYGSEGVEQDNLV